MWLYTPGHETTFVRIYLIYYPIEALYIRLSRSPSNKPAARSYLPDA